MNMNKIEKWIMWSIFMILTTDFLNWIFPSLVKMGATRYLVENSPFLFVGLYMLAVYFLFGWLNNGLQSLWNYYRKIRQKS